MRAILFAQGTTGPHQQRFYSSGGAGEGRQQQLPQSQPIFHFDAARAMSISGMRHSQRTRQHLADNGDDTTTDSCDDDDDDSDNDEAYARDSASELCSMPFRRGDAVRDTLNGGHLIILDVLGQGAYAVVYRARDTRSGQLVALKCLSKRGLTWDQLSLQREEAKLHKSLGVHPNIVHLHRYFENKDWLFLVLEYCPGQDMYCWVTEHRDEADAKGRPRSAIEQRRVVKDVFAQVLEAVSYCHQRGVFHRDLKPENFIVCADGVVKLTDFGLATTEKATAEFDCGSQPYMSHECRVPLDKTYSPRQADIWSLGVLLLALLYRRTPWPQACPETSQQFQRFLDHPDAYLRDVFGCEPGLTAFLTRRVLCPVEQGRVGVAEWLRMWYDDLVLPTSDSARKRFGASRVLPPSNAEHAKRRMPFASPSRPFALPQPQPKPQSQVRAPMPSLASRFAESVRKSTRTTPKELAHSAPAESFLQPPNASPLRTLRAKLSWSDLADDEMDFTAPLVFDDAADHDAPVGKVSPAPIALSTKSSADSGFVSSADVSPATSFDQQRLEKVAEAMPPAPLPIPIRSATRTTTPVHHMATDLIGKKRYGTGFTEDELLFAMDRLGW